VRNEKRRRIESAKSVALLMDTTVAPACLWRKIWLNWLALLIEKEDGRLGLETRIQQWPQWNETSTSKKHKLVDSGDHGSDDDYLT
jgi:hypothetical protein